MATESKVASNLESISWYLNQLSVRAIESGLPNSEEFKVAALIARESLDVLICQLKPKAEISVQDEKTIREESE